jgi:hypothetical protein
MKILAIVDVTSSAPDMYGNRYHLGSVINTKTGETKTFSMDSESNTGGYVKDALETIYPKDKNARYKTYVTLRQVPIKHFDRMRKGLPYERDIDLLALLSPKKGKKA